MMPDDLLVQAMAWDDLNPHATRRGKLRDCVDAFLQFGGVADEQPTMPSPAGSKRLLNCVPAVEPLSAG